MKWTEETQAWVVIKVQIQEVAEASVVAEAVEATAVAEEAVEAMEAAEVEVEVEVADTGVVVDMVEDVENGYR